MKYVAKMNSTPYSDAYVERFDNVNDAITEIVGLLSHVLDSDCRDMFRDANDFDTSVRISGKHDDNDNVSVSVVMTLHADPNIDDAVDMSDEIATITLDNGA